MKVEIRDDVVSVVGPDPEITMTGASHDLTISVSEIDSITGPTTRKAIQTLITEG